MKEFFKEVRNKMEEKILIVLQEIKKELQDIRSILEPKEVGVKFTPEDSINGKHYNDTRKMLKP